MPVPLARASLFDAASENDLTLFLDAKGEYLVGAFNMVGRYRDFIRALFDDEDGGLYAQLMNGHVPINFLFLMEETARCWGDEFIGEILPEGLSAPAQWHN